MLDINYYIEALNEAICNKKSRDIANVFFELSHSLKPNLQIPDEAFAFVLSFLKDENFVKMESSIWAFLFMENEYIRLTKPQKQSFLNYLNEELPLTIHQDFLYAICCFIVDNNSSKSAFSIFKECSQNSSLNHQKIAKAGMQLLSDTLTRKSLDTEVIDELKKELIKFL